MSGRLPPWPESHSTVAFIVHISEFFSASGAPDVAARLAQLSEELSPPAERRKLALRPRDDLIRALARDHYPATLSTRVKARMIADDLAAMASPILPPPHARNATLREILALSDDESLSSERIRQILRAAG
jgi:hypothetical protein